MRRALLQPASQAGLIAHFSYLAEHSDPIVLYNVPGRTVTDIEDETVVELVRIIPTGSWRSRMRAATCRAWPITAWPIEGFRQLSGNDELWLPHAAAGGSRISVTANVAPSSAPNSTRRSPPTNWRRRAN